MEYKYLGKTGVKISQLCFGTMSFGAKADKKTSQEMYKLCREKGINFFDCANVYQKGRAEEYLGEFIKEERHDLVITTKGFSPMSEKINDCGSSRKNLTTALNNSLRRLKTDYVDIYFLHGFDIHTPVEETLRILQDFVSNGKILYIGLSNYAAWQISKMLTIAELRNTTPVHCIQPMYNLAKRQAEVEILPLAEEEKLGVVTYSPLGGGLLTGKYGINKKPDTGRLVDNPMYNTRYGGDFYYETAEKYTKYAAETGINPVSLAVAWAASNKAVTAPIIGAGSVEQLKPSLDSVNIKITDEMKEQLNRISPPPPPATDRSEEKTKFNYSEMLKNNK